MTDADKGMNTHSGSDLADTGIASIRKSGFKSRITFDRGNQSSRDQVHLALTDVCCLRAHLIIDVPAAIVLSRSMTRRPIN